MPNQYDVLKFADPATFQLLKPCRTAEVWKTFYSKDKNYVYCGDIVLPGADTLTFEYVGSYDYDENTESFMPTSSGVAKDKNCIYRREQRIVDSSQRCIKPTGCTSESLSKNPKSCGIDGPWGEFE